MLRLAILLTTGLLLSGCGDGVKDAQQHLVDSLPIKKDVEFQNTRTYPGSVVCGEYNAYESYKDPKVGFKPFMVVRGTVHNPPKDQDHAIYCSDDPAQSLLQETGIGPFTASNKALAKITIDFARLSEALEAYYKDNFYYPRIEHGLGGLVKPIQSRGRPVKNKPGGYISEVPLDPWGRPYIYFEEQWGRTQGHFVITTLGASGAEGGTAENMDITSIHLPYLRHIAIINGQLEP